MWATHPQYYAQIYDTTSGVQWDPVLVAQARREEMQFLMEKMQTWDYDTVENCVRHTGAQPIPMVWVDVTKGDEMRPKVRSRLCVAETRGRTSLDLADPSQTLFATPPIEALRLLVSMTMSPRSTAEGYHVLMFVDIARARPHCTMNRDLWVRLPAEDPRSQDVGVCGLLRRVLYGCRDAGQKFELFTREVMEKHLGWCLDALCVFVKGWRACSLRLRGQFRREGREREVEAVL